MSRTVRWHSGLFGLVALAVYVAYAPRHVVAADNAEFSTLAALGGGAHPPGYPLYVLWLRAWSWLPAASPAHAAAIATAILGALSIGVLHAACRAWGARPAPAAIAVAIVGAAPIVIAYHSQAEVFALNGLIAALIVWLVAERGPVRGRWRGAALGLVAGLGLANHLTCALLAPIGLFGVVRAARESRASTYAVALAALAVGLLPYGYLFVADGPASWGTVTTLDGLIATVLRREYGGFELMPGAARVPWTESVGACVATIARAWLWGFAAAGAVMLGVRIARPAGESRWAWALLAASLVLAGPGLVSRFDIEPHGIGLYICQRFHVLPALLLAVPVATAIDVAWRRLAAWRASRVGPAGSAERTTEAAGRGEAAAIAAVLVGFVALSIAALPRLSRDDSPAMELGVRNMLRSLPTGAIAVVVSEDQCFGGQYLQLARGERPDVALVCSELLRRDWYRAAWAGRGLMLPVDPGRPLGEALVRTGRPVLVDRGLGALVAAFPSYPFGVLYRVVPAGASPPAASAIAELNRDLFRGFDLDYPRPGRDDNFAAVAHRRYAAAWAAIGELLDAAGDPGAARDAIDVARSLQPRQD